MKLKQQLSCELTLFSGLKFFSATQSVGVVINRNKLKKNLNNCCVLTNSVDAAWNFHGN